MLETPEAVFEAVDGVVFASTEEAVLADPALVAAIRRTNRSNLTTWAQANLHEPGARVEPTSAPTPSASPATSSAAASARRRSTRTGRARTSRGGRGWRWRSR